MKCPKCGGELERQEDNKYVCPSCHAKFAARSAAKPQNTKADVASDAEKNENSVQAGDASHSEQTSMPAPDAYETSHSAQNDLNAEDEQTAKENSDSEPQPSAPVTPASNPPALPPQNITASSIRDGARPLVKKNLGYCVLTNILLELVRIGSVFTLLIFGTLLIGGAIKSSYAGYFLDVANDKCEGSKSTYRGFNNFMPALRLNLLCALMTLIPIIMLIVTVLICLRMPSLAFAINLGVILGILVIFAFSYISCISQYAFYGLNSGVSQKATELISHASKLVNKNFGKILFLKLSFIGWWLLNMWTWGLLYFYISPYYKTALAKQYLAFVEAQNQTPAVA